jgi:hypothetical protein
MWDSMLLGLSPMVLFLGGVALFALVLLWDREDRKKNVATGVFTFLGVFLALYATEQAQEAATRQRLAQVGVAARGEIDESIAVIKDFKNPSGDMADPRVSVLERPARALGTLVAMPDFLERENPKTAARLLTLTTRLHPSSRIRSARGGGGSEFPMPADVLRDLKEARELLTSSVLLDEAETQR